MIRAAAAPGDGRRLPAVALAAAGSVLAVGLQPGFSCRAWMETDPITDAPQIEVLDFALDSANP